ncbi:MAG: Rieske 2Fe-2S domain-containing protein [Myxococcota bacterium]|jgi:3-phenylpropionate/trans-cinnamate dioxygenase ferredoxin subunit
MAFTRVAALDEIPDDAGLRVSLGDLELGIYRIDGELYAMDDICPHAGSSLSEGFLAGTCVVCPAHLWEFDVRTGLPPEVTAGKSLARYPVEVRGQDVLVDPAAPIED